MLTVKADQLHAVAKRRFFERLDDLIARNSAREDWKAWAADTARTHGLWESAWPVVREAPEFHAALYLVLLAAATFEGTEAAVRAMPVGAMAERELPIRERLAREGFLRFGALDEPDGDRA